METYFDYNRISKALQSAYEILSEDETVSAEARASILEAEQSLRAAIKYVSIRN
ncbi:hypothetical protein [Heyndrickxia acidicola]|uniref:Uncharacterized protein n=1 Tax=Heyndrickxia acidicola TaxID=209389 RepID=A0ABU6MK31_9BACI|nr:hypothetical protein [Heyndrickxia acidicola]MED1205046.1 hypothetical protein [Heyndrickxia acidicola]